MLFLYRLFSIADEKEQEDSTGLNRVKNVFKEREGLVMKKEQFIELGVSEELAAKCETASQDELKGFIPKTRFDEVNGEKKKLEESLKERDSQLESLKNSTSDVEGLKKQIEDLQAENKTKDDNYKAEIQQLKVNAAVESALHSANAKNVVAVKALLKDLDKAVVGEDGTIAGLADQIKALQKTDSYLFETKEAGAAKLKGAEAGHSGDDGGEPGKPDTSKMTYSEMVKYLDANPGTKL